MGGTCTNDNDTNRHDYLQSVTFQWLSCVAPPSRGYGVAPVAALVMVKLAGGVLVAIVVLLLSLKHVVESECIGGRHPSASDLVSE